MYKKNLFYIFAEKLIKGMKFRKANIEEFDKIWEIVDQARNAMLAKGRRQWTKDYPSRETITNDIVSNHAYVIAENEDILAYGAINKNGETSYEHIHGHWLSDREYLVLHRLAVNLNHLNRGLAKIFFNEAEKMAENGNIHSIKVDTNFDNVEMLHLLSKMGYSYCGEVSYGERGDRMAFEKLFNRNTATTSPVLAE